MFRLTDISTMLIWSFFAGVCIALLYAYYVKHVIGSVIRYLIEKECFSEESAKELPETNAFDSLMLKIALRKNAGIYQTVSVCEGNRYFITEDKKEKARRKYKGDVKLYQIIAAAAAFLIAALLISYFFDNIYKFFEDMINSVADGFSSIGKGEAQ